MKLTLEQAMEMAESLTTDRHDSLSTLGSTGDEVAILLHARVAGLEAREQRIREAAFHPLFNSLESVATIKTILTLG